MSEDKCVYCGGEPDIDDFGLIACNACLDERPEIQNKLNKQAAHEESRWA